MGMSTDESSDEEWWSAAISGDGRAFGVVFDRHSAAVYSHALSRTASGPDAEDIASLTFLEAWRKRGQVRFVNGSAKPWLLSVATNLCRNHARALRRHHAQIAKLPHDSNPIDTAETALSNIHRRELQRTVAAALGRLRREEHEVICLCDLAGLSYGEVAGAINVPVGTVRSRLSRARTHLRQILAPFDPFTDSSNPTASQPQSAPLGMGQTS